MLKICNPLICKTLKNIFISCLESKNLSGICVIANDVLVD